MLFPSAQRVDADNADAAGARHHHYNTTGQARLVKITSWVSKTLEGVPRMCLPMAGRIASRKQGNACKRRKKGERCQILVGRPGLIELALRLLTHCDVSRLSQSFAVVAAGSAVG